MCPENPESRILYETTYFWVEKQNKKFLVHLKLPWKSYNVGEKESLEAAQQFIARAERYPNNLKYMLPLEMQYQFKIQA
jgi:hypothetical protein